MEMQSLPKSLKYKTALNVSRSGFCDFVTPLGLPVLQRGELLVPEKKITPVLRTIKCDPSGTRTQDLLIKSQ